MELKNEDGGWGLQLESHSCMFCTALSYICIRILGENEGNNVCVRARKWILDRGGVTYIPSWGKAWLSVFPSITPFVASYKILLRSLIQDIFEKLILMII